ALCIVGGQKVWSIRVDVRALDDDGNLGDVCAIAALCSLLHFRKADVEIRGEEARTFTAEERVPVPLSIHHLPVPVTFALFAGTGGAGKEGEPAWILDPNRLEEAAMRGALCIAVNQHGELCGVHKPGGMPIDFAMVEHCIELAVARAKEITSRIQSEIEADLLKRKETKKNIHQQFNQATLLTVDWSASDAKEASKPSAPAPPPQRQVLPAVTPAVIAPVPTAASVESLQDASAAASASGSGARWRTRAQGRQAAGPQDAENGMAGIDRVALEAGIAQAKGDLLIEQIMQWQHTTTISSLPRPLALAIIRQCTHFGPYPFWLKRTILKLKPQSCNFCHESTAWRVPVAMEQVLHVDVCIIGAGPAGLAALSAIHEPFSLDQLSKDQSERALRNLRNESGDQKVCVVDPMPWLSHWKRRFKALDIKWLRSPAMAHPDLFDATSLRAFAGAKDRESELLESDVVNSELKSLEEAHNGLWKLPSNRLFEDFSDDLASRLPHEFVHGAAACVEGDDGDFRVRLTDGREIAAGTVVLALGVPGQPVIPQSLLGIPPSLLFHTDFQQGFRLAELEEKHEVLVIGGGLTAVQAAQLAARRGCKVTLCSRRPLVTRHFDVATRWFDKRHGDRLRFEFFSQPLEQRLKGIKAARGGGSVPPAYMEELKEMGSKVDVLCADVQVHAILDDAVEVLIQGKIRRFDRIVAACGHAPQCCSIPVVHELIAKSPVELAGGLPQLSPDLQWGEHKQLFVVGALAALQVGPDAGNLMGIRRAAQIVARVVGRRDWLIDTKSVLGNIRGNRYAALSDSEDGIGERSTNSNGGSSSSDGEEELVAKLQPQRCKKCEKTTMKRKKGGRGKA
ncbi:unnamed protein product, partial [Polarella glacialis]